MFFLRINRLLDLIPWEMRRNMYMMEYRLRMSLVSCEYGQVQIGIVVILIITMKDHIVPTSILKAMMAILKAMMAMPSWM